MCVSGILSLSDSLELVTSQARIIQEKWGPEKGSMMAVEADLEDVERLLYENSKVNPGGTAVSNACFNGPRSFTLAGSA